MIPDTQIFFAFKTTNSVAAADNVTTENATVATNTTEKTTQDMQKEVNEYIRSYLQHSPNLTRGFSKVNPHLEQIRKQEESKQASKVSQSHTELPINIQETKVPGDLSHCILLRIKDEIDIIKDRLEFYTEPTKIIEPKLQKDHTEVLEAFQKVELQNSLSTNALQNSMEDLKGRIQALSQIRKTSASEKARLAALLLKLEKTADNIDSKSTAFMMDGYKNERLERIASDVNQVKTDWPVFQATIADALDKARLLQTREIDEVRKLVATANAQIEKEKEKNEETLERLRVAESKVRASEADKLALNSELQIVKSGLQSMKLSLKVLTSSQTADSKPEKEVKDLKHRLDSTKEDRRPETRLKTGK